MIVIILRLRPTDIAARCVKTGSTARHNQFYISRGARTKRDAQSKHGSGWNDMLSEQSNAAVVGLGQAARGCNTADVDG